MTYGVGSMLGAALGGAMADYLGWRWEFGVQVPVVVFCLVVAALVVPSDLGLHGKEKQTIREAMRTFDFKGSVLMASSVTFLILGLVRTLSHCWRAATDRPDRISAETCSPGLTPL